MISTVSFNWFHQSGAIRRSDKRHSWLFFFTQSLNVHPLVNDATTNMSVADFRRFLETTGHQPVLVQLEKAELK